MVSVGITGMGSYAPPKVLTNDDMAKIVDTSDEWIYSRIGIKERRVVEGSVCTSDLAVLASEAALEDAGITAEDLDMIVLATSSPDVPMSSTAGILQGKLGAVNAGAFDLGAVCTGYVYALDVGAKYAADPDYDHVLVVGAEVYSKILNWEDRTTCVFFGDGAGAAVVSECDEGKGILASYLKADGRGAEVIKIPAGGTKRPISHKAIDEGLQYFHMDGRAVWDFAIVALPDAVRGALSRCGRTLDEVDMVISHQSNINIISTGMEALGLPMEKTFTNLRRYGNMAGASIPVALHEAVQEGKIGSGDLVVLAGYGGGLAWGANAMIWI